MEIPEHSQWYTSSSEEVLDTVRSRREGLSEDEASSRLARYGYNELVEPKSKSILKMILDQLSDHMVLILMGAALLSALLNEWIEAFVILVIIVVDALIGVIQEKKATDALNALRGMSAPHAKVKREDDLKIILARDLVQGDIVYLEAGDIVSADLRLVEVNSLEIQESSLTGESLPVEKSSESLAGESIPLGDRINMAYMSTIVTNGNGFGVVCERGMNTEVGQIADSLAVQEETPTPLTRKLNKLGTILTLIGLGVCVLVFVLGVVQGFALIPLVMTAISLSISIIPEGLPATATIVMALGVERMAKEQVLVKGLANVETLGSATVICTDKTGTLTENKMKAVEVAVNGDFLKQSPRSVADLNVDDPIYNRLIDIAILCNNAEFDPDHGNSIIGDPTEGALLMLGRDFHPDIDDYRDRYLKLDEIAFDSERKRMSVVYQITPKKAYVLTKGACEEVLENSRFIQDTSGIRELTDLDGEHILAMTRDMAARALRVLAMAYKEYDDAESDEAVESNLVFVGLIGMIDPPRKEIIPTMNAFHQAGIRVVMITGDHPMTALAIAKSVGIYSDKNRLLTSDDLERLSDEELKPILKEVSVFSRVSPQEKLRIVELLNETGEVSAMMGDGVNDSPSLKAADIGIAMGSGTEVSKDAADVILLDDDFTTLETAIREGRRIYRNIQKVVQFLVAGNVAEILTILLALILGWEQPILAIHILLINLVTDNIPAIALGVDPAEKRMMKTKPIRTNSLFSDGLGFRVILHGLFITAVSIAAYSYGILNSGHDTAMTMTFFTLAISQLFHALNQRSNIDSVFVRTAHNKWLVYAMILSALILGLLVFIPPLREFFQLVSLTLTQWVIVFALSLAVILFVEVYKWVLRHRQD